MSPSRWTFSIGAVSARRAPVVPLNEPGVRRAGTGVCFSGGENRSRGESMGVAIGCEGAWPWDPPADPGPGVGCAEGARWFRGLRRGDRRGTDEGGPMGAGVICAASSPPAIEVVRGCAERVGQGLLGVPRSSDPRVTDKDERFLNEARVRAPARDARRGREASPADQTRTSDRFRRVMRRPIHRVVAVALRRHGGALSRAPRSARTLLAPEDFSLSSCAPSAMQSKSFTCHAREKTVGFPIDHDGVSNRVARAGARWAPRLRGASGMSRTTRETMRAGRTCVFPSPLPVSPHPARDDPRTAAFSATATLTRAS